MLNKLLHVTDPKIFIKTIIYLKKLEKVSCSFIFSMHSINIFLYHWIDKINALRDFFDFLIYFRFRVKTALVPSSVLNGIHVSHEKILWQFHFGFSFIIYFLRCNVLKVTINIFHLFLFL